MALKVKNLLDIKGLSSLRLMCGEGGLENKIWSAGIVDYEFFPQVEYHNDSAFEKQSFVITSLLYAYNNEEILLNSIKELYNAEVSGMAYKNIFYDKLPKSVIDFADEHNFPIFSFGKDIYFENFIFTIMNELNNDDKSILTVEVLEKMIRNRFQRKEIYRIAKSLSLTFKKNTMAIYVSSIKKNRSFDMDRIIRNYYLSKQLHRKSLLCKYKEGFFIIITSDQLFDKFGIIVNEIVDVLGLNKSDYYFSSSNLHNAYEELDCCIKESYFTYQVTVAENRNLCNYDKIGTYKLILPIINERFIKVISENLMLVGAGNIATFQVAAMLKVFPNIKTVTFYDPISFEFAQNKAKDMPNILSEKFNITTVGNVRFSATEEPKSALSIADIVITVTPSREPLIKKEWVKPGTHFSCIGADMSGKEEIAPEILKGARIFVDDLEQCTNVGEIEIPIKNKIISKNDVIGEIGDVINEVKIGRTNDKEITVFDATGTALLDIITAQLAFSHAEEKKLGSSVNL